jgi:dTDP-3-amino-3,4,6-trideoxy-alpha-D-glucose transaminase
MSGLTIPFTGIRKQYNNLRTEILDATDIVLRSGQLMSGNYTYEFEDWLARRNHQPYAVTCHSGTQALEIIAEWYRTQLGVPDIPTVAVPTMTYPATLNAFVRAGWNIHIVDTDQYGVMDLAKLEHNTDVQAICGVGLYGQSVANMTQTLWALTHPIIEDGAQHWLSNDCQRVGDCAISFDPTKNLANYGNGGAVITANAGLKDFAQNWISNGKHSRHAEIGTNSRMSEIDCAQMLVKTRYIDQWQQRRRTIAKHWMEMLKGKPWITCLIDDSNFDKHCFHKFVIHVDNRDILQRNLALRGVETKVHYPTPMHELPAYQHYPCPDLLSAGSSLARRCLSLPIYPELTDLEVEYVIDSVLDCVS